MEDEAIQYFLTKINIYKYIKVQTLQSQVQDSVEKYKHMRKHKVKLTMSQEKPLVQVLVP